MCPKVKCPRRRAAPSGWTENFAQVVSAVDENPELLPEGEQEYKSEAPATVPERNRAAHRGSAAEAADAVSCGRIVFYIFLS
jgi:hypothetical protein